MPRVHRASARVTVGSVTSSEKRQRHLMLKIAEKFGISFRARVDFSGKPKFLTSGRVGDAGKADTEEDTYAGQ